jgi:tetrahydromethanopterin S-methyltransferase subunit F
METNNSMIIKEIKTDRSLIKHRIRAITKVIRKIKVATMMNNIMKKIPIIISNNSNIVRNRPEKKVEINIRRSSQFMNRNRKITSSLNLLFINRNKRKTNLNHYHQPVNLSKISQHFRF